MHALLVVKGQGSKSHGRVADIFGHPDCAPARWTTRDHGLHELHVTVHDIPADMFEPTLGDLQTWFGQPGEAPFPDGTLLYFAFDKED